MTLENDTNETIEYYKDLLLYQYINLPKARLVIDAAVRSAVVDLLPIAMRDAFDIETATGDQLDIIGEYVGLSRIVPIQVDRDYFVFDDYEMPLTNPVGFTSWEETLQNIDGSTYNYVLSVNSWSTLEDSEYRLLLKLKVILNASSNTTYEIFSLLQDFFGNDLVFFDGQDMTISYLVTSNIQRIVSIAYDVGLLPKPMGVFISGLYAIEDPTKLWGFADYLYDNGYTIGFSDYEGAWADGVVLNYLDKVR